MNILQILIEVHLVQSDDEELSCVFLCTKKRVTSAVPTEYYNILSVICEGSTVRPSLHFQTVRKYDYRTVIRRVKDTDVPDIVGRKHVPRVHITALSGYGRN